MAAQRKDEEKKKGKDGSKKGSGRKGDKPKKAVEATGPQPEQIYNGPVTVTAYGSNVIKMVGYRKADNTVEWWGMCKGFRLGPATPGSSQSRTFTMPSGAPVVTNAVEFVAWALPILQTNNPGETSFDWEICTLQAI